AANPNLGKQKIYKKCLQEKLSNTGKLKLRENRSTDLKEQNLSKQKFKHSESKRENKKNCIFSKKLVQDLGMIVIKRDLITVV
ncbi:665_t:CDS:2, partial [Gigaspora margarita]